MKILGIRTAPSVVRYAILTMGEDGAILFENANSENKIDFPSDCQKTVEKLPWLSKEILRIFRQNNDINKIIIKASEYGRGRETTASREAAYYDSAVIIQAGLQTSPIPVEVKVYRGLGNGIKRNTIKAIAEEKVGKTDKYWNEQIADAVIAALSGLEIL